MVNINTEAVLTTFTRLGRFLSLRCLVILDFNTALCSPCGLATAIGHISVITLLSRLHNAILVASRPIRLLPRYFLHLCYVGAYALRNSLPLAVWLRCRFIQAAIALFFDPSSVALLLMLVVGFRCVFCFDFCFSISTFAHPRSSLLQHVITPSVFTLRPFALYFTSWRVLGSFCGRWRDRTACSS